MKTNTASETAIIVNGKSLPFTSRFINLDSNGVPDEITPDFLEACKFGYDSDTGFWYRHHIGITVLVNELDSGWSLSIVSIHSTLSDWAYHKETIRTSALPVHLLMLLGACQSEI